MPEEFAPGCPRPAPNPPAGASRLRSLVPEAVGIRLFRRYLAGLAPLSLGTWMQLVALGYLTLRVTGSPTAVGLVGAADGIPAIALALPAGAAGDRWPRPAVLAAASSAMGFISLGLAVAAGTGHASLAVLVLGAILLGSATAFDAPTRQAMVADMVPRSQLLGAVAVTGTVGSLTRILGPAIGGVLLGTAGAAACFAAMAALVLPYLLVLARNRWPAPERRARTGGAMAELLGGLTWAIRHRTGRSVLAAGWVLGVLGVGYMPFLPVFARYHLHGGGQVLGVMYSVGGFGALAGGVTIGVLSRRLRRHTLLIAAAPLYGASLFTLTRVTSLPEAVPCLAGISLGFLAANSAMLSTLQAEAPPELRNRVLALYALGYSGGGPLGSLLYAALAAETSLFGAIAAGSVMVGAALLWCGLGMKLGHRREAPLTS
ncbi:MAG: MFS transporter [Candidatus Dormibacteraeota bacterium]|nr:MFS transporter [Candidatus Dormibacteraeota bacterium]